MIELQNGVPVDVPIPPPAPPTSTPSEPTGTVVNSPRPDRVRRPAAGSPQSQFLALFLTCRRNRLLTCRQSATTAMLDARHAISREIQTALMAPLPEASLSRKRPDPQSAIVHGGWHAPRARIEVRVPCRQTRMAIPPVQVPKRKSR